MLSDLSESVAAKTDTLFVIQPACGGRATMLTVAEPFTAIPPSSHRTTSPLRAHAPCDAPAETKAMPAGSTFEITTPAAALGPRFVTPTV